MACPVVMQRFGVAAVLLLVTVVQTMAQQAQQDHRSHNRTSKAEKKQMKKYVEEYVPAAYWNEALREEGLSKYSNHKDSDSSSEEGAMHGASSFIELLEQAQQDHQSNNKTETSKAEKKQMKKYVEEYVPEEYQKKAMRDEDLSKDSKHRNSQGGVMHGLGSSIDLLEQAQRDHQSHNKTKTSKAEQKQMRKYIEKYVPEEYQKKILRQEGLSKQSIHEDSQGGATHASGSSIELLEQADHQSQNKTSKAEKKQMRKSVEEYVPAEYQKQAMREEGLANHNAGKDGMGKTAKRASFLSSDPRDSTSVGFTRCFNWLLHVMGVTFCLTFVVFKKRRADQVVNFPESTLG